MKNIFACFLLGLLIAFIIGDAVAVLHSIYFALTHIHLTRMEMIFDPENKFFLKLLSVLWTWVVFRIICAMSE